MAAQVLSGKPVAEAILLDLKRRTAALGYSPRLAVVRAGEEPSSARYVKNLTKTAASAGVEVVVETLPEAITLPEFRAVVRRLAADPTVHGVQIQKPIPEGRHLSEILEAIPPEKDVEGLHPTNVGLLLLGRPRFLPCTPAAVLRLLDHAKFSLKGCPTTLIGRSDIVGKPLAALLIGRSATVTVCHSQTQDVAAEVARAKLVIVAAGVPQLVRATWLDPAAVVVDVGFHVLNDGRICGDVEASAVDHVAAWTPVPGGIGPITVAELLNNVVLAASG